MSLYLEHFKLRELPFRITPAVSFFYRGCVRGEILEAIKYAIGNGEGIMTVVGEVGTGKSLLCRVLMTEMAAEAELVYIANPSLNHQEIVYHIAEELGLDISRERHHVTRDLQRHLLDLHAEGRRVLVCIDEAQAMPDDSLEQIRLLSNLETSTDKIVQIIMFGQPELSDKLSQRHMRQLRERITSAFYLRQLNQEEVADYVSFRMHSAGQAQGEESFSPNAIAAITKVSQGIARRINILCDKAMLAAFADNATTISSSHVKKAAHDARYKRMEEDTGGAKSNSFGAKTWMAAGAAVAAVAAIAYQAMQESPGTNEQQSQSVAIEKPPTQIATTITVTQPVTVSSPVTVTAKAAPAQAVQSQTTQAAVRPAQTKPVPVPEKQTQLTSEEIPSTASLDNPRWDKFPPSSYLRQRLNVTQTMFNNAGEAEQYTARILTVPRANAIETERYLRDLARFFEIRNIIIYPAAETSGDVFVIAYGVFPSEFQAELFIHELPSFFRTSKPFVQAMAVARLEAASNW